MLELPAPAGYTVEQLANMTITQIGGRYNASSNIILGYRLVYARPVLRHEQRGRAEMKATEWAATEAQMLERKG
ncbi:hypothetical protein BpJC7_26100 [Weizmannia acidilactici]|uniref:Uncharacterized protein n=1 Tax=Weizmannia acidilactici TaxID=2607726 RepID=A0A5J4JLP8_9BACI|nr:hypothetical protein [Weizmannia acidilactici]GER71307.1 hypothetical protein BpJC7_26100 [Weizmannia acidilactici]